MDEKYYVTYIDLKNILDQFTETMLKGEEKLEEARMSALVQLRDLFIQEFHNLEYRRIRDLKFFMNMMSSLGFGSIEHLEKYYDTYCAEFDKLNKQEDQDESKADS